RSRRSARRWSSCPAAFLLIPGWRTKASRFGCRAWAFCLAYVASPVSARPRQFGGHGRHLSGSSCLGFVIRNQATCAFDVVPASVRASAASVSNLVETGVSGFAPFLSGAAADDRDGPTNGIHSGALYLRRLWTMAFPPPPGGSV